MSWKDFSGSNSKYDYAMFLAEMSKDTEDPSLCKRAFPKCPLEPNDVTYYLDNPDEFCASTQRKIDYYTREFSLL